MPELGVMDLGFVGNAVALAKDGVLPADPSFLVELDDSFPAARWAAHGNGVGTFAVVEAALSQGRHARVGLEDTDVGPDVEQMGNVDQVRWAVEATARVCRQVATVEQARSVLVLR